MRVRNPHFTWAFLTPFGVFFDFKGRGTVKRRPLEVLTLEAVLPDLLRPLDLRSAGGASRILTSRNLLHVLRVLGKSFCRVNPLSLTQPLVGPEGLRERF